MAIAAMLAVPAFAGATQVYWTHEEASGGEILTGTLGSGEGKVLFHQPEDSSPEGIAIDPGGNRVYWTDAGSGGIKAGPIGGEATGAATTLFAGEHDPVGLTFDAITGRLYWTDAGSGEVRSGPVTGEAKEAAITLYKDEELPEGITVDPASGKLYWADIETDEIRVGELGGEAAAPAGELVADTQRLSGGVAVDPAAGKLYWTDEPNAPGEPDLIREASLSGGALTTLYEEPTAAVSYGIALDPGAGGLFWANFGTGEIRVGGVGGQSEVGASTAFSTEGDGPNFLALLGGPVGDGVPAITGNALAGQALTCSAGAWATDAPAASYYQAPSAFAYQWLRDGAVLSGATSASFTPSAGGTYTCEVTAANPAGASAQTSAAVNVPAPAPSATIALPASGGVYPKGHVVATAFSCAEGAGGPGLASCDDSKGTATISGGSGKLSTSTLGVHTYTVTAVSKDGLKSSTSISYKVIKRPCDPRACTPPGKIATLKILSKKATVARHKAKLKLACLATGKACKGKITLTLKVKRRVRVHHGKHVKMVTRVKTIKLAHASFKTASRKHKTVTLRLSRKALTLVKQARKHRLKTAAAATVKGGKAAHRKVLLIAQGGGKTMGGSLT